MQAAGSSLSAQEQAASIARMERALTDKVLTFAVAHKTEITKLLEAPAVNRTDPHLQEQIALLTRIIRDGAKNVATHDLVGLNAFIAHHPLITSGFKQHYSHQVAPLVEALSEARPELLEDTLSVVWQKHGQDVRDIIDELGKERDVNAAHGKLSEVYSLFAHFDAREEHDKRDKGNLRFDNYYVEQGTGSKYFKDPAKWRGVIDELKGIPGVLDRVADDLAEERYKPAHDIIVAFKKDYKDQVLSAMKAEKARHTSAARAA